MRSSSSHCSRPRQYLKGVEAQNGFIQLDGGRDVQYPENKSKVPRFLPLFGSKLSGQRLVSPEHGNREHSSARILQRNRTKPNRSIIRDWNDDFRDRLFRVLVH